MIGFSRMAVLSMAVAWTAFTLSEATIFQALRDWVSNRSSWLGKLLRCGYCSSFWIAAAFVLADRSYPSGSWRLPDLLLTILAVAWLAAYQWAMLCWLTEKAGK